MKRRYFLGVMVAAMVVPIMIFRQPNASSGDVACAEKVIKTDAEWRAALDPRQYRVLRRAGTERAFSSVLNDEKRTGTYVCAACDLPLFKAPMKFDSGTGWPSFFTHIPGAIETKIDFKMIYPRQEYHCACCGGHQGHVFDDGPQPSGQRWCNNGVALRFIQA